MCNHIDSFLFPQDFGESSSFVWCFGFEVAVPVSAGGQVKRREILEPRFGQVIGDLGLALAGFVGAGGLYKQSPDIH